MQTLILVRHGYPASWDQQLKVRSSPAHLRHDPALAAIGLDQATRCAAHLTAEGGATVVLSSPFRACLETADLIAAACATTVKPDWRLGQVLLSTVLGSPFSPGNSLDPEWEERRTGAGKPSHPESDDTIKTRLVQVVKDLKARKPLAQRIVIVSHDIILKELLNHLTGRAITVDWHPGALTTATLATAADRAWRQKGKLADCAHLGDTDRTEPQEHIEHRYHPLDSRS